MLYTNLKHIETSTGLERAISENENVVLDCGSMGQMCISVYRISEELEAEYKHIKFFDMEFENPESSVIRNLPEVQRFEGIPFTVYFKNGFVVKATSGIQSNVQIIRILDNVFADDTSDSDVSSALKINSVFQFGSE